MTTGADESSVEAFLKQADIARQRQAWDDVIKIFQVALKQAPEERRFRFGLANAYSGKADQAGFRPLHQRALEEYWRLVNSDPSDDKAHDALLATAVKADQLAEVMEEYRSLMAKFPESTIYRDTFKKIQTLYFLRAEPVQPAPAGGGIIHILAGRAAPLGALGCLLGWVVVRGKIGANIASAGKNLLLMNAVFSRVGLFLFFGSLAYYTLRYLRTRR